MIGQPGSRELTDAQSMRNGRGRRISRITVDQKRKETNEGGKGEYNCLAIRSFELMVATSDPSNL